MGKVAGCSAPSPSSPSGSRPATRAGSIRSSRCGRSEGTGQPSFGHRQVSRRKMEHVLLRSLRFLERRYATDASGSVRAVATPQTQDLITVLSPRAGVDGANGRVRAPTDRLSHNRVGHRGQLLLVIEAEDGFPLGENGLPLEKTLCIPKKRSIPGENSLFLEKTVCLWKKQSIPGENGLSPEKTLCIPKKRSDPGENGLSPEKTLCIPKKRSDPGENGLSPEKTLCLWKKRSDPGENGLSPRGQTVSGLKCGQKKGACQARPAEIDER